MEEKNYSLDLDDFSTEIHTFLSSVQDGVAGHFARFTGTRKDCIERITKHIEKFVEDKIYESDEYGYQLND